MFTFEGIKLRKLERRDLPKLLELKSESWFGTHHVTILNSEDQERWFDSLDNHPTSPRDLYFICQNENFEDVGLFKINNIDWPNGCADIGYDTFEYYRCKGYGKRLLKAGVAFCFDVLNLRRLTAEILATNVGSLKCAAHAGFIQEGCKRAAVQKDGRWIDSLMFGMLRSDR
jgi:RimJ/RimL family protein N-acetyltransferase